VSGRAPHYPGRAAIDAYGAGHFRFAGMAHKGSILALPSGIYAFAPNSVVEIDAASLAPVIAEAKDIEILLLGTGRELAPLAKPLRARLSEAGIRFDVMPTSAAASTYNVLLAEGRRVAAALIAVE
jgi:uncharacterized protein